MKTGLLIIASEILDGKILDLNTKFLAEYLYQNSLHLELTITVKDEQETIQKALGNLFDRCDLIITSGGLGPTQDDLTKECVAQFLERKISYSLEAQKVAEQNYARFNRPFPGREHLYSELPDGFIALNNPVGYAPGYFATHAQNHTEKKLICAPGVPREFKAMLEEHLPRLVLDQLLKTKFSENLVFRTKGIPEEKIFFELDKNLWNSLSEFGSVSSLPVLYGVDIGVKIHSETKKELEIIKSRVNSAIKSSPVFEHIWHMGPESVEELIIKIANQKNITFGFAESCTGGLCSHRITNVSGSSQAFLGSVISYSEKVKENLLHVLSETIESFGVVSESVAKEMAIGAQESLGADIGVSVTGIAGPSGGTLEKPVGSVSLGIAHRGLVKTMSYEFKGDRELLKNRFAQVVLFHLLDELRSI